MAQPRILLTGATGFVGPRLLAHLKSGVFATAEYLVWDYRPQDPKPDPRTHIDICSAAAVATSVAAFRPTHIVHLAAQSHVPTSYINPQLTWQVNVMGSLNLFEAVKKHAPKAGIVFISTSEVYGRSFQGGQTLDESALLQPLNPYAASKAAADLMAGQYAAQGLRIVRLRAFNHIGPGQREDFVASAFAAQIARIESDPSLDPVIRTGNLEVQRDFLAVNDVVRAYSLVLGKIFELPFGSIFNICSGVPVKIGDLLAGLLKHARRPISIEIDPARLRPSEMPLVLGSSAAARQILDWKPEAQLLEILPQILEAWRLKIRAATGS